jgi:hypothetical protein
MTARNSESVPIFLTNWIILGNSMPPRDPSEDDDDEEEEDEEDEEDGDCRIR